MPLDKYLEAFQRLIPSAWSRDPTAYILKREKSRHYRGPFQTVRENIVRGTGHSMPQNGGGEHQPLLGHLSDGIGNFARGHDLTKNDNAFVRWPAEALKTTWTVLKTNPVNLLLIFVPLGIIAGNVGWNPSVVFVMNFLAIIPLAALLSFATEEVSVKVGQTLGGLLNATFGNAVELIVRFTPLNLHTPEGLTYPF